MSICIGKASTDIDRLITIWKSDFYDKIRQEFFQAVDMFVLLYGYTSGTLIKHLENKLAANNTKMLHAVLNKF